MTFSLRGLAAACLLVASGLQPAAAQQAYPSRSIRAVLPYSAGSGPDAVLRHVGEKLSQSAGMQVVIENKPGANGWLAIESVKRAAADGYTLLEVDNTHMALQPHLYKQLPFDPAKDFEPVAPLYWPHSFIVVPANSGWNRVADLGAAAKASPGKMTYGTWGIGSVAHVGSAMLETATGARMTHVPFKELPQLYTAVANGEVGWAFGSAATAGPLYKAKKVKLLALAAPKRLAEYGDIPTVSEAGGPANFELKTWVALFGPRGMPKAAVDKINAGVNQALAEPDVLARMANFGFESWRGTPADITKAAAADSTRFAKTVAERGTTLD